MGTKEEAAGALCSLARDNPDNRVAIARAGGIAPLVTLFHCGTKKQTEMANYALRNLGRNNADIGKAIQRQMKAYARW